MAPSELGSREDFAAALTALRTRSGLSIRALAHALQTPTATIGDYCSGRHLPGPAQQELFAEMLTLLGVPEDQLSEWLALVSRLRLASDGRVRRASAPYQGLAPFEATDRSRFFGREAVTDEILRRLRAQASGRTASRLVLVVGPSGSGKSSLLRAGVQARLEAGALHSEPERGAGSWRTALMLPGEDPLASLRNAISQLPDQRRVLIIDQLGEIFAAPAEIQEQFFSELEQLQSPGTLLLAGLRASFYEQAVAVPILFEAMRRNPILLGPMNEEELRSAIVGPAHQAGVPVDEGLVEVLLADLAPREATGFAHDAGALPLLSHALLRSWELARWNRLSIADYRAAGGLYGAVRQTAEESYQQLTLPQRELARRLFMRLVRAPQDGPAVGRRAQRFELDALEDGDGGGGGSGRGQAAEVVERFVDARLLTVDAETVALSHEALLTAWPRLANWIEENRESLGLHRRLTDLTHEWLANDRDPELLLRGGRLQLISDWVAEAGHSAELNAPERELLEASQELALREQRSERRRSRQMRSLLATTVAMLALALVLVGVAMNANHNATTARNNALSRQLALQSASLAPIKPDLAMQLALLAHRIAPTANATSALLEASSGEMPTRLLGPTGPAYLSSAPAARRLAVAYSAADSVRVYRLSGSVPRLLTTVRTGPTSAQTFAVALSPDGRLLAAGGTAQRVLLWSLQNPARPRQLATLALSGGTVYGLSFSSDGGLLAAVNATGVVHLWSLRSGRPVTLPVLSDTTQGALHTVRFAPVGQELAAASSTGQVLIWRELSRRSLPLSLQLTGTPTINALGFNPSASELAAGGTDNLVYRWRLSGHGQPVALAPLHGFSNWVQSLTFSPNGRELAAGSSDNTLRLWSAQDGSAIAVLKQPAPITGAAFAPGGGRLISVDSAGTVRLWSLPAPTTFTATGSIFGLDFTTSGRELAVISSGAKGAAQLWNTTDQATPSLIANVPTGAFGAVAGAGALSADGRLLAVSNAKAQVQLFDVSNPRTPRRLGGPLTGATPYIEQMSFSHGGRLLAAGDDGGHIHLWDVSNPAQPVSEPELKPPGSAQIVLGVAFSPDDRLLASADTSGHVRLWDVSNPGHPRLLAEVGHFAGYAYSVAFTPDGRTLVAGGADRTVRLWDISNPRHPRAIGSPLDGPTSAIYSVAVNSDGSRVAAATTDGYVWLWTLSADRNPKLLASLATSAGNFFSVSFRPHSNAVVAGGSDQLLHIWDDSPGQVARRICSVAGTPITRSEWSLYVQTPGYAPPCK